MTSSGVAPRSAGVSPSSPLLDVSIEGAKGVLLNITGDTSLTISEVHEAAELIRKSVDPNANIIFGVAHEASMGDSVRITLIATGFEDNRHIAPKEEEVREMLTNLKEEDKLDTPTFLRNPLPNRRRQATAFSSEIRAARPDAVRQ